MENNLRKPIDFDTFNILAEKRGLDVKIVLDSIICSLPSDDPTQHSVIEIHNYRTNPQLDINDTYLELINPLIEEYKKIT